jgi:hypothetical protein
MNTKWGWLGKLGTLAVLLVVMAGCRTSQVDLKPPPAPEVLNPPPSEARFNTPNYPRQALNIDDPGKRLGAGTNQGVIPARGPVGPGTGMNSPLGR